MMIQKIFSFDEYEGVVNELAKHPQYSDPHFTYDKNNLYCSLKSKDKHAYVVLENGITKGLFVFIVLPDDRYVEMLIGFTKEEEAFIEMLEYMERNYCGYQMDFVFNPQNMAIYKPLKLKGAIFEPEQMKMIQGGFVPNVSTSNIETLSDRWMKQYYDLHNTDTYWTAKRIVSALDKFRVFLAVKDEQVLGYLDVQSCYDINEIYALYVKPEVVSQGYELALLANAIELNRPNQMMVVVDVDNREEVDLYTAAGFVKLEGHNSMTAYIPQLISGLDQSNLTEYITQFCRHSASQ